jgi:anti-sigma regulatory factor (Ser/Thr protein kinase)
MSSDLQTTAQLLTSELVTNALQHGYGTIEMHVSVDPETLRVEVSDDSPEPPQPMEASPGSTSGRGVMLVEALASDWGVTRHADDGKAVWFALTI